MALFPNLQDNGYKFRGKTHTNLVISEGMAPAEHFIISRTNTATPFLYEYGEDGNQMVVLAKGKIVEVAGVEYDHETGYHKTAVKQATDGTTKAIGVNLHNVYARRRDGMHSTITKPTVITRNYIEVPLFETEGTSSLDASSKLAVAMRYGAATSDTGSDDLKIEVGDYVTSDANGNFRKWVEGTDLEGAKVGQVLAKETELPPAGFLQYYQELVNPQMEEYFKLISQNTPTPGNDNKKSIGGYPYGAPYEHKGWKPEFEKMLANARLTGIPFLTDGFFRAQEIKQFGSDSSDYVEVVRGSENVKVEGAQVTVAAKTRSAAIFVKLKHQIDVTKLSEMNVTIDGTKVDAQDIHVDAMKKTVVIYLPENMTDSEKVYNAVNITMPLVIDPIAGIPTEWDYAGSTGAIRVLLQK